MSSRSLVESPGEATPDSIIGEAILGDLHRLGEPESLNTEMRNPKASVASVPAWIGWQLHLEFDSDILRNGSNPLDLLDDLRKLGVCFAVALTDDVPFLDELDPERCFLKWDVTLHSDCERSAIDDVFIFVQDEMKLDCRPLAATETPPAAIETPPVAAEFAPPLQPEKPTADPQPLKVAIDAGHPATFDSMQSGEALLFLYSRVWPSLGEPDKVSTY